MLVLRLCTSDSVEVKLLRRANSKLALERLVIKKGAFQGEPDGGAAGNNSLSAQDLLEVLKGDMRLEVRVSLRCVVRELPACRATTRQSSVCLATRPARRARLRVGRGDGSLTWLMVCVQGDAQNSTVDDKTLDMLLDRTHLAKKIACPYPASGPGYELVAQQSAGLLSSVQ